MALEIFALSGFDPLLGRNTCYARYTCNTASGLYTLHTV